MLSILIGFLFSGLIGFTAFIKKSLSLSGAVAATVLGTGIYYFGGLYMSIIMISFFISSSVLTKFKKQKKKMAYDLHEKSGGRDYIQVFANGGVGLVLAALWFFTKEDIYLVAYTVSFAAANADTWASEIGVLSKYKPISILNFRTAESGVSGAVSFLGTISAILGAGFIGVVFFILYLLIYGYNNNSVIFFITVVLLGFTGCIVDSFLGAVLQAKYRCEVCGKVTEGKVHHGKATKFESGVKFINNDAVNIISILFAALLAVKVL